MRRSSLRLLAVSGVLSCVLMPQIVLGQAEPATSEAVKIDSGTFIYEEAPFASCHASTIVEMANGRLMAAWFAGSYEKHPDVGIWVAEQTADGAWTTPVEVANGVQHASLRYPCWNPVLVRNHQSEVISLYYKCGPSPSEWWGMLMTWDGTAWSRPVRLPEQIDGPVKNKPLRLADGTLLCGSSTEYDGWRVHFEITRDDGLTWERVGPINDGREFNAIQPSILTHADGRLQILCRSKEGNVVTSWSSDQGQTWTAVERTMLPNPNSGTDAVTLKDGRHVIVYNNTPKGRSPLNVAVSKDGVHWEDKLILESEPGEYSYPAIIQSENGDVQITYTWKRLKIKHVTVDPEQL